MRLWLDPLATMASTATSNITSASKLRLTVVFFSLLWGVTWRAHPAAATVTEQARRCITRCWKPARK
jgi:hypothetical protein